MSEVAGDAIIDIRNLSRHYGKRAALDRVSLTLPRGAVLGLVGVNGSGKTTLIRHVLGLLGAEAGTVRVFGLDPCPDMVRVLSRLGYVSEDSELPGWMRVGELMRYTAAFYPRWDYEYADQLQHEFALDRGWRVSALSRGQRGRLALLLALAHRPELLVLDEPSGGLDPIARRDILQAIVRDVSRDGRTVLFSSHLLDEVERIADHIALIDAGRVAFSGELDVVRERHRRLTLRFDEPRSAPPALEGVLAWEGEGREWTAVCSVGREVVEQRLGGRVVEETVPRLDELFTAHASSARKEG